MNRSIMEVIVELKEGNGGHICYFYINETTYIDNVVSFVVTEIKNGNHVVLVENDRHILLINKKLQKELNKEELTHLHVINNYDFYYFSGNFHPHTVVDYFTKKIEPFLEKGASVSTWGLVEWGDDKEIHDNIAEYEQEVEKIVKEKGIVSVCAYNANRTAESLKVMLEKCHGVMITVDETVNLK
ncbi:MEDS domain-containing protein [Pseudobacillus wudalianchiensis]|uniref:MEDS domain-containing protein n=1 Tax=Pseudobacillus wudalianchiensis TaxID=1743143 RepID=A0A1B9AE61_9BACI|nr:MEDS domain-containing protein [Bacillus wudalianchiensis]OCA82127.1 hypothetical protein A8F95_15645 [Bacillus wudalianchiensis]